MGIFTTSDLAPTLGGSVVTALGDITGQLWVVIPVGLAVFGIIYGLGKVKQAAKKAAA